MAGLFHDIVLPTCSALPLSIERDPRYPNTAFLIYRSSAGHRVLIGVRAKNSANEILVGAAITRANESQRVPVLETVNRLHLALDPGIRFIVSGNLVGVQVAVELFRACDARSLLNLAIRRCWFAIEAALDEFVDAAHSDDGMPDDERSTLANMLTCPEERRAEPVAAAR